MINTQPECPLCEGEGKVSRSILYGYEEIVENADFSEDFQNLEHDHEKLCRKALSLIEIIKDLDIEYLAELELKNKTEGKYEPRFSGLRQKLNELAEDVLHLT